MRRHALLVLTAGLLIAADNPKDDAAKDLAKLKGTWLLVSAQRDGKKLPEEEVKKTKITFAGDTFLFPDASGIGTSQNRDDQGRSQQEPQMDGRDGHQRARQGTNLLGYLRDRWRRL
jgi:hypothetical protein